MKYPRKWKNKISGKVVRVMPWWETVKDGEVEEVDELGHMISQVAGRPTKFGVLVQIGFLMENEAGVWFGLNLNAREQFDDVTNNTAKSGEE